MVDYPALAIQPANVLSSFLGGVQARDELATSSVRRATALDELKAKREEREKESEAFKLAEAIAGKDPLAKLMAYNPEMGNTLLKYQQTKKQEIADRQQADAAKKNEMIANAAKLAATVKQAPLDQRPQAYAQALTLAQQRGIDITGLPAQYSPDIEPMLDQVINAGRGLENIIKQEGGFTLGEGEKRYNSQGRLIAEGTAKAPPGFRPAGNGALEPIPGGPEDIKREEKKAAIQKSMKLAENKANLVSNKVDEALGILENESIGPDFISPLAPTGFTGAVSSYVPGTDAYKLDKTISTIQANIGFDTLQQMREASPTGGALGAVSERELDLLVSSLENLAVGQDTKTLKRNLAAVKTHYQNWLDTVKKASVGDEKQKNSDAAKTVDFNDLPE